VGILYAEFENEARNTKILCTIQVGRGQKCNNKKEIKVWG